MRCSSASPGARAGTPGMKHAARWGQRASAAGQRTGKLRPAGRQRLHDWGLRAMRGNVREWTADRYRTYTGFAAVSPSGTGNGSRRVYRGGSVSDVAGGMRAADRTFQLCSGTALLPAIHAGMLVLAEPSGTLARIAQREGVAARHVLQRERSGGASPGLHTATTKSRSRSRGPPRPNRSSTKWSVHLHLFLKHHTRCLGSILRCLSMLGFVEPTVKISPY